MYRRMQQKITSFSKFSIRQVQSAKLETERIQQLRNYSFNPSLHQTVNMYFDMQHHALLDNLHSIIHSFRSSQPSAVSSSQQSVNTVRAAQPAVSSLQSTQPAVSSLQSTQPAVNSLQSTQSSVLLPSQQSTQTVKVQPTQLAQAAQSARPAKPTVPVVSSIPFMGNKQPFVQKPVTFTATPSLHLSDKENQPPAVTPASHKPRRVPNTPLNPVAVRIMTTWYNRNLEHPYPSSDATQVMASAGGITPEQVNIISYNK